MGRSYRNTHKRALVEAGLDLGVLTPAATTSAAGGAGVAPPAPLTAPDLLTCTSPRQGWIQWLQPRFLPSDGGTCAYFTGTYCDEYGYSNGLTLPRNVHKDFRRFLDEVRLDSSDFICGVEHHRYRDILHLHAVLQGAFSPEQLRFLKRWWSVDRGHARVLPVLDGCVSYITKYALKHDTDNFDWRLA